MTDNMITEKDIAFLKSYETVLGKIMNWAVILMPVFLFLLCGFNLYMASRISGNAGYDLGYLLQLWIRGVNPYAEYSGMLVVAMERLLAAALQVCFAIVFVILAYAYHKRRKMDYRILATLKSKGISIPLLLP